MLEKFLPVIHRHKRHIETGKLCFIALLALISLFVSILVLWESPWTGFRFIYVFIPHLYLIPIILLVLWYPKSGLRVLGIILLSVVAFWIFSDVYGYQFSIAFVMLYTGLDLATIMVLLLYVKDRRLVEAVISDLIERGERRIDDKVSKFGGDFDSIIQALASQDENEREEAVDALAELSDARTILPLIRGLGDESQYVRRSAADALGKTGTLKAVQPLMKALADDDRYVRETAAEALGHLGDIAISGIVKGLSDQDWRIRVGSLVALRVTSGAIPSLEVVLNRMYDESPYVRREAVKTIGRIGNRSIVPYVIQATKDDDPGVRIRAIKALGKLGSENEIMPVINRCMQDEDSLVRVRAREEFNRLKGG
jgi:hypothetical protein